MKYKCKQWGNVLGFCFLCVNLTMMLACGVPKCIQQRFTLKYEGEDNVVRAPMRMDGFYHYKVPYTYGSFEGSFFNDTIIEIHDTLDLTYWFFPDGTYASNFIILCADSSYMVDNFDVMAGNALDCVKDSFEIYAPYWGIYNVVGDTIITQTINNPNPPKEWLGGEEYFLILDSTTILQMGERPLEKMRDYDWEIWYKKLEKKKYAPAFFIKTEYIPNSDSWLKKEKWFWRDEEKYINWMNTHQAREGLHLSR